MGDILHVLDGNDKKKNYTRIKFQRSYKIRFYLKETSAPRVKYKYLQSISKKPHEVDLHAMNNAKEKKT